MPLIALGRKGANQAVLNIKIMELLFVLCEETVHYVGLLQLSVALLAPDDSLLPFPQLKSSFIKQNETSFIWDRWWWCHLTLVFTPD